MLKKLYSAIILALVFTAQASLHAQCLPPNPLGITVTIGSSNPTAAIHWLPVSGATSYNYAIMLFPSPPPSIATTTTNNVITVAGLQPNTKYSVCVQSNCPGGPSVWNCDTFNTNVPPVICDTPASLTAFATGPNNAIGGWQPVNGAVAYDYQLAARGSSPGNITATSFAGFAISGLKPGTVYDVCVRARCSNSLSSSWVCDSFFTTWATNVENVMAHPVSIYPNPVTDKCYIDAGSETISDLTVVDVYGRITYSLSKPLHGEAVIDMSGYPAGAYTMRYRTSSGVYHQQLQKL